MKNSSDIDALHTQVILLKMRGKTTEELMSILAEKSPKHWSQEEHETAERVLQERTGNPPKQTVPSGKRINQSQSKQHANADQPGGKSFFNLSPIGNLQAAIVIFVLSSFFVGFIFVNMGRQNTKWFLTFSQNAQISDIEKIEVQEIDANRNNIGNAITISDEENIREFVSALKTIEEYSTYHPTQEKRIKVRIWLTEKNQTIGLEGRQHFSSY